MILTFKLQSITLLPSIGEYHLNTAYVEEMGYKKQILRTGQTKQSVALSISVCCTVQIHPPVSLIQTTAPFYLGELVSPAQMQRVHTVWQSSISAGPVQIILDDVFVCPAHSIYIDQD